MKHQFLLLIGMVLSQSAHALDADLQLRVRNLLNQVADRQVSCADAQIETQEVRRLIGLNAQNAGGGVHAAQLDEDFHQVDQILRESLHGRLGQLNDEVPCLLSRFIEFDHEDLKSAYDRLFVTLHHSTLLYSVGWERVIKRKLIRMGVIADPRLEAEGNEHEVFPNVARQLVF